jgi:hypothetical protein
VSQAYQGSTSQSGGEDYQYESSKLMQKSLHLDVNDHLEAGEHIVSICRLALATHHSLGGKR